MDPFMMQLSHTVHNERVQEATNPRELSRLDAFSFSPLFNARGVVSMLNDQFKAQSRTVSVLFSSFLR